MKKVPPSLKVWFVIHFIVDVIFAIPLIFSPTIFMGLVGLSLSGAITARLVGAALVGIGGASFLVRNADLSVYKALLKLKLLWSSAAVLSLTLSIHQGEGCFLWIILIIFSAFFVLWGYYLVRLNRPH